MRIAIDINGLMGLKGGLCRYIELLIKNLAKIDKENEYFLFGCFFRNFYERIKNLNLPKQENFHLIAKRFPESIALLLDWKLNLNFYERILEKYKIDIFHGTGNILPNLRKIKSVVTIHHLKGPIPDSTLWGKFYFLNLTKQSILHADRVIAVSDNTKKDIIEMFQLSESKITTIYEGETDEMFYVINNPNKNLLKKYNLPDKFLLFIGPLNERKNVPRLLEAFSILKKRNQIPHKLLVTGRKFDDDFFSVRKKCIELDLENEVIFTDFVPKEELAHIYNLAEMLIYPSLYEGFGHPPLEAMACGCPVVASNVSSIPEVVGDAGILFDPYNVEEMANAMEKVLTDNQLRRELIKKGFGQVKKFSWEKTAKQTSEVYKKVYQNE